MGLQDAERGQMGVTRVQVKGFTHKSVRGAGEESQRQVQEEEQSRDGEKSGEKMLLPNGTRPMFLKSPYTCESVRRLSKRPGTQCSLSVSVMTKDTETTQYLWTVAAVFDYEPMVLLQPCTSNAIFIWWLVYEQTFPSYV